jgi:hypothetical protein
MPLRCRRRWQIEVYVTVLRVKFFIIKPTRCTNFSNLFWNEILVASDSSSVHFQEFSTVHTAMVYVVQVCWHLASRIRMEHPDPARAVPLFIIRSFSLYTQQWHMSYRFVDSSWAGSGWKILILLKRCLQTYVAYAIAVCIVKNLLHAVAQLFEALRYRSEGRGFNSR